MRWNWIIFVDAVTSHVLLPIWIELLCWHLVAHCAAFPSQGMRRNALRNWVMNLVCVCVFSHSKMYIKFAFFHTFHARETCNYLNSMCISQGQMRWVLLWFYILTTSKQARGKNSNFIERIFSPPSALRLMFMQIYVNKQILDIKNINASET